MWYGRKDVAQPRVGCCAGFTLVEMLVVISIIVLLMGLSLHVGASAYRHAEVRRTEDTLRILDQAMQEWELLADRRLSWGVDGGPGGPHFDVHPSPTTTFNLVLPEMLDTISRPEPIRRILTQIPPSRIYIFEEGVYPIWMTREEERSAKDARFVGGMAILDAWDMPIYGLHPGGPPKNTTLIIDPDGTEQTINEMYFGVAVDRRIGFISAGPDGDFGDLSDAPGSPRFEATRDNIFSYPVGRPGS